MSRVDRGIAFGGTG